MKKIKIKIANYDPSDTLSYGHYILEKLQKRYEVELTENPDYLFFNDGSFEHLNHNCIKIFFTGENIHPNFNTCDYAFGFDYLNLGDRYARLPVYFIATFYRKKELTDLKLSDLASVPEFTREELEAKTGFCSFVYSNYLADDSRKNMFDKLSAYKQVSSGGRYLNNIGGPTDNKLGFESKHKFSIAFENSSNDGYTTEKIINAFAARTIPIYWGNPLVGLEFNTKRFINCNEYANFDEVVEMVKKIDNDDELYLKIINEPILSGNFLEETENAFDAFLYNIFDQQKESAKRIKINPAREIDILENEKVIFAHLTKKAARRKLMAGLYKPFKKLAFIDTLKQKFFIYRNKK